MLCSAGKSPNSRPVPIVNDGGEGSTRAVDAGLERRRGFGRQHREDQRRASTAPRPCPRGRRGPPAGTIRRAAGRSAAAGSRRSTGGWPSRSTRAADRASSRLAMFAQAMSSTRPVTRHQQAERRLALRRRPSSGRASRPRARSALALKRASVWSLMPRCSGASTSLMIARYGTLICVRACIDRDAGPAAARTRTPSSSVGCRTG